MPDKNKTKDRQYRWEVVVPSGRVYKIPRELARSGLIPTGNLRKVLATTPLTYETAPTK